MIKVESKVDDVKGILMLAFEASREEEYETLDMLFHVLSGVLDARMGYVKSNRLVGHFKGVIPPLGDET